PYTLTVRLRAPPTPATHTLSLHDALPIYPDVPLGDAHTATDGGAARRAHRGIGRRCSHGLQHGIARSAEPGGTPAGGGAAALGEDRKSTRLNSSHVKISYAVFCLKKKNRT